MKSGILSLLMLCFIFILSQTISAHLSKGEELIIDGFLIDFGYAPQTPLTNATTQLSFILFDASSRRQLNPTSADISISSKNKIIHKRTYTLQQGTINFNYTFIDHGIHTVSARFFDHDKLIVESASYILITNASSVFSVNKFLLILLAIIMFSFMLLVIIRKKSKS